MRAQSNESLSQRKIADNKGAANARRVECLQLWNADISIFLELSPVSFSFQSVKVYRARAYQPETGGKLSLTG